ncbi:MAG: FitA-like ribbon-helix-helix domain-containing protein [Pseudonocardiaceae bacterium]
MATIQIRDVSDGVHRIYQQRAALAGMSLQEYLRAELTRNARTRTGARDNLTVCNGWYVALAESLDTSLVTADRRLTQASGPRVAGIAPLRHRISDILAA